MAKNMQYERQVDTATHEEDNEIELQDMPSTKQRGGKNAYQNLDRFPSAKDSSQAQDETMDDEDDGESVEDEEDSIDESQMDTEA